MHLPKINHNFIAQILFLCITIVGIAANAPALMLEMRPEELAPEADSIIVGQVLHRKSHWNRDKSKIYTRIVISTEEHLKGNTHSGNIVVVLPGGKIGDTTLEVTEVPDFSVGEKVVVFIRPLSDQQVADDGLVSTGDNAPWFRIHGGFQGKFSVFEDKVGKQTLKKFKERISKALTGEIPDNPESNSLLNIDSASSFVSISGITPSSASAGTNTLITISGSNLGTSPGTPNFYYKSNVYYPCPTSKCVSSWSDFNAMVMVPVFAASDGYSASAGSGPVYLKTAFGDKSNSFPFTVTFSYGGSKWTGADPVVEFKVNPNGNAGFLKAVQDAANTWNAVPNKSFSFKFAGTTAAVNSSTESINEVIWADLQDSSIIGQTSIRKSNGVISECNITFNTKFPWSTDAATPKNAMDVHTVALHELGHWLNLRDLYGNVTGYPTDIEKVMYGYGSNGTQKRNLTLYDSMGMRYIYPGENPCAASLTLMNSAYHLFVPFTNTTPNLWVDFQFDPDAPNKPMFRLVNSGEPANPSTFNACQPSALSLVGNNHILHIPELNFNGFSYRIDLTHVPSTDGRIWFMLSNVSPN